MYDLTISQEQAENEKPSRNEPRARAELEAERLRARHRLALQINQMEYMFNSDLISYVSVA